ncbi:MAG: metallophosphoesterase [bacterium]
MKIIIKLCLICVMVCSQLEGTTISPFNKRTLKKESPEPYSFYLIGHAYGQPYDGKILPATTLLMNLDYINQDKEAKMLVFLGDIVGPNNLQAFQLFDFLVSEKVKVPIFNAVGNHDVSELYNERYGAQRYFSFDIDSTRFIFLDTQIDHGYISGKQWEFFKSKMLEENKLIKNIFIFSHHLIWADHPEFQFFQGDSVLIRNKNMHANSTSSFPETNFRSQLLPLLEKVKDEKNVYWASGDVGLGHTANIFFDKVNNITYIATGLAEISSDSLVRVKVSGERIDFEHIPLIPQFNQRSNKDITVYNTTYWKKMFEETKTKFIYRVFHLHILTNKYFYYGIFATLFGGFLLIRFKKVGVFDRVKKWIKHYLKSS